MNDPHDWKTMYPDPENGLPPYRSNYGPIFWFVSGALGMLGILGFIAIVGLNIK